MACNTPSNSLAIGHNAVVSFRSACHHCRSLSLTLQRNRSPGQPRVLVALHLGSNIFSRFLQVENVGTRDEVQLPSHTPWGIWPRRFASRIAAFLLPAGFILHPTIGPFISTGPLLFFFILTSLLACCMVVAADAVVLMGAHCHEVKSAGN